MSVSSTPLESSIQQDRHAASLSDLVGHKTKIVASDLSVFYGKKCALSSVTAEIYEKSVTALIGPSGCGKSTFLRCINRMNDTIEGCKVEGSIFIDDNDIYGRECDPSELRTSVGMVFQKPTPFPKSIYDNVAYGPRIHGLCKDKDELDFLVEASLKRAGLWKEIDGRLKQSALDLSGGQQQRLCIARAIAVKPAILLMDEPCSALDPIATGAIEELITELKTNFTILIVTHSMHQAQRISSYTGFFHMGRLIEFNLTAPIFNGDASCTETKDYISGKFG